MPLNPTPPQLFDDFEQELITREQLHAGLAWHARGLVEEIIEVHENPIAGWWDTVFAKRAAARWTNRHGIWRIRHILHALSRVPDFEPAHLLWNALHPDVPVYCFFRMRRDPVFRLLRVEHRKGFLRVRVEFGDSDGHVTKQDFIMEHVRNGLEATEASISNNH